MALEQKVYRFAKKIPKGKVTTYELLAKAIGKRKATRAVGNVLNKNPLAPQVPCHRVVKSDGKAGGFAKGTRKKIAMLKAEGIEIKNGKIENLKKYLFRF